MDSLLPGMISDKGLSRIVVVKKIGTEEFHLVFEARPGKREMALALIKFFVKM